MKMKEQQAMRSDKGDFFVQFLIKRKYRAARHIFIIGFILLITFVLKKKPEFEGAYDMISTIVTLVTLIGMFYINLYVLIPIFFYRKKPIIYLMLVLALISMVVILVKLVHNGFIESHRIVGRTEPEPGLFIAIVVVALMLSPLLFASTAVKLFQKWVLDVNRLTELENKYLETQLRELRNQINPHFLFNMLNNVNEMIFKDPENASRLVVKFSEFLRYNLEETDQSQVYLSSEIKFLTDFINLEKIRRDDFTTSVEVKGDIKGVKVPPKLFINFIENALKHSANNRSTSSVQIEFSVQDKILHFYCQNTKPEHEISRKGIGIGLSNVRQRLELLYGSAHTLIIADAAQSFSVTLQFPI